MNRAQIAISVAAALALVAVVLFPPCRRFEIFECAGCDFLAGGQWVPEERDFLFFNPDLYIDDGLAPPRLFERQSRHVFVDKRRLVIESLTIVAAAFASILALRGKYVTFRTHLRKRAILLAPILAASAPLPLWSDFWVTVIGRTSFITTPHTYFPVALFIFATGPKEVQNTIHPVVGLTVWLVFSGIVYAAIWVLSRWWPRPNSA